MAPATVLSAEAIAAAQQEARELGNTNVVFEVRDLTDFDRTAEPASFDLITTFDAVHDQADPSAPLLYTLSCMHCMTVSLARGGEGLGAMWGREKVEAYFRSAGFGNIEVHELGHDLQNYWYVCRP